jgi:hypothetical protein
VALLSARPLQASQPQLLLQRGGQSVGVGPVYGTSALIGRRCVPPSSQSCTGSRTEALHVATWRHLWRMMMWWVASVRPRRRHLRSQSRIRRRSRCPSPSSTRCQNLSRGETSALVRVRVVSSRVLISVGCLTREDSDKSTLCIGI